MNKAAKLDRLIDDAEELLTQLADAHDPHIRQLRDQVDTAITAARRNIAAEGRDFTVQLRDVMHIIDDYIRDYPWLALATGALLAGACGYIVGAAVTGRKPPADDWYQ